MLSFLKETGKHTFIFSLSGILSKAIGFFMLPLYTHYLNPSDYGVLELLSLTLLIYAAFVVQGLPSAVLRFFSFQYHDNKEMQKKTVNTAIFYLLATAGIFCFIFFIFAGYISHLIFNSKNYTHLLQMIAVTIFLGTSTHVPIAVLRVKLKSVQLSMAFIAHLVINISINILLIVGLGLGLRGVIYGNLIAAAALSLILYCLIAKDLAWSFSLKVLKDMLSFGLPLVPGTLALFIINGSDKYFLQHFSNADQVGLYSVGYKISIIISYVLFEPFLLVWPSIYFPIAAKPDAQENFARFASLFILLAAFISLGLILFSQPMIVLITPEQFWTAASICIWIVPALALNGICNLLNVGLYIKRKTNLITIITLITTMLNLLLNYGLIPHLGMKGAAVSTFLTFLFMSVLTYFFNDKIYPISYQWNKIIKILILFVLALAISYFYPHGNIYLLLLKNFIILCLFIFGVFLSSFFSESEKAKIFEILKKIYATCIRSG